MRLHFPNKEHDDVLIANGDTSIGGAPDNAIVLARNGIAAHHAKLTVGDRGIVLTADPQARTHVNARPIREKAILRLGDVVSLDTLQFVLKPDRDDSIRQAIPTRVTPIPVAPDSGDNITRMRIAPPKAVLRGVSGTYFGKIIAVRNRLVIGRGTDCDLILDEPEMSRRHAVIENSGDSIFLRDLGSANGTFVNGVQVRDAILYPDDQIAFDRNRFLLEAPGLPGRNDAANFPDHNAPDITQTMQAVRLPNRAPAEAGNGKSKNDIWWLIAAAALIGIGIAVLLLVKF